jgi:hypothetical protein
MSRMLTSVCNIVHLLAYGFKGYPERNWEAWKFENTRTKFWSNEQNEKIFLTSLAQQLGISKLDDWYTISYKHFKSMKGNDLICVY